MKTMSVCFSTKSNLISIWLAYMLMGPGLLIGNFCEPICDRGLCIQITITGMITQKLGHVGP